MQAKTLGKPNGLLAGFLAEIAGKNFSAADNIVVVPLIGTQDENCVCLAEFMTLEQTANSRTLLIAHSDGFHLWDMERDELGLPRVHLAVLVGPSVNFSTARAAATGVRTLGVPNELPWPTALCSVVAKDVLTTLSKCPGDAR